MPVFRELRTEVSVAHVPWSQCLGAPRESALVAAVEACGGPVILVGWSLGCLVSLEAVAARPGRVSGMVLAAGTARMTAKDDYPGLEGRKLGTMRRRFEREPDRVIREFCQLCLAPREDEELLALLLRMAERQDATALAAGLGYLENTDLRPLLPALTLPVIVLHGQLDAVIPYASGECLSRRLSRARLETFGGEGHALLYSAAGEVARAIRSLLDGCGT